MKIPRLFGGRKAAPVMDSWDDGGPITSSHDLLKGFLLQWGMASAAGISVNPHTALECPTVWAAVKVLSETIAQLPFNIIKIGADGTRRIAENHPVQQKIGTHGKPNEFQSSFEFREFLARHVALVGNAFYLRNTVRGELRELLPIHPGRVEVQQNADFSIIYKIHSTDGGTVQYSPKQIFHLRGPGDAAFVGDSVIRRQSQAIGLALAQDRYAALLFGHGVNNSGVLSHPGKLSQEAYQRLKESLENKNAGLANAHKTMLLEEGMKWETTQQNNQEAQMMEARKLQREIIAGIWRIPPHMVGALDNATFSNIENLARQFVDYAMMPWLLRIEGAVETQLLTDAERTGGYRAKFNVNALLRGDAKTRAQFYAALADRAALSANEIREKEDMDPYEGGDQYFRQLNMDPANAEDAEPDPNDPAEPDEPVEPGDPDDPNSPDN